MRIQHNIAALNAYRNYSSNTNAVSKNLEKLTSGYRINRAGDDAAGLAISEKMRAQITGLTTAQDNANNGISLVQSAEGSLTEVHDMLNRMVELADQSANGTYDDKTDRANLQKEVSQLKSEINRIADSANFNGIKLLDGSLAGSTTITTGETISVGTLIASDTTLLPTEKAATNISYTTAAAKEVASGNTIVAGKLAFTVKDETGVATTIEVDTSEVDASGDTQTADVVAAQLVSDLKNNAEFSALFDVSADSSDQLVFTAKDNSTSLVSMTTDAATTGLVTNALNEVVLTPTAATAASSVVQIGMKAIASGDVFTVAGKTYEFVAADGDDTKTDSATAVVIGSDTAASIANLDTALQKNGYTVAYTDQNGDPISGAADTDILTFTQVGATPGVDGGTSTKGGLTLLIGETSDDFNKLTVSIQDMHVKSLGIESVDISSQKGGEDAADLIKSAINSVSGVRGTLGATQNRLEHTINNLSVMNENTTDAESSIRDVDVAKEMMEYTKNNILVQSAQAMLAQANQLPQGVLQLLQ